ncbi:hypothetical protein [Paraglaciecola sp. 2405UD69-4]|uniref:hypothetical protein n=1 Tax=Paraglaciecola sp. 2405UD69-4 TaxID=3391836 RepID=UPI0039C94E1D
MCIAIRFCLLLGSILLTPLAVAHDSNIATFQVRHIGPDRWVYEIMAPLAALDMSLRAELETGSTVADLSLDDPVYKKALVKHLKKGFNMNALTNPLEGGEFEHLATLSLGAGRIKLEPHLSVLIFDIKNMPSAPDALKFHISSMSQNPSQLNLLRLIEGQRTKKYILNHNNNFSGLDKGFFTAEATQTINVAS